MREGKYSGNISKNSTSNIIKVIENYLPKNILKIGGKITKGFLTRYDLEFGKTVKQK